MAPRKVRVLERYQKLGIPTTSRKLGGEVPRRRLALAALVAHADAKLCAADEAKPSVAKCSKLGAGYTPGTVLVVVAGRFVWKRVVFLKQLSSELLLVAGRFKCNRVSLGCVKQAYVLGTSTKFDISGIDIDKFNGQYFAKEVMKKAKGESKLFETQSGYLLREPTLLYEGADAVNRIPVAVPGRSKVEPAPEDKEDGDSDDDDEEDEDDEDNADEDDDDGGEEDASGDEGEEDGNDPEANGQGGSDDDDNEDDDDEDDEDGEDDEEEEEDDEEEDEEEIPQPSAKRRK